MIIIVVVATVEYVGCVIVLIAGHDLVRIEFVAYDEVVNVGIVEFISVVVRKEPIRIVVVAYSLVVRKDVRDVVVARQEIVRIVVVFGSAIGGVMCVRGVVW